MARYIGPVCRLCRREGMKLFLKGERCYRRSARSRSAMCLRPARPRRAAKMVGYGIQLREKQKVKRTYGVLENQFRRYFEAADRQKGVTGELLLQSLERRLDNVIYRWVRHVAAQARQLVRHGHFTSTARRSTSRRMRCARATPSPCAHGRARTRPSSTRWKRSRAGASPSG